jgi:hypothetical protein
MQFFEVTVNIKTESSNGKIKNVKEVYLVDSMSVTEAEARIVEDFRSSGFSQDFKVILVRESKVNGVIFPIPKKEKGEQHN